MQFLIFLLNILDPFRIVRNYLLKPCINAGIFILEGSKQKTQRGIQTTKNVFIKFVIFGFIAFVIISASIFMYAYFYYTYMPALTHSKEVFLNFRSCTEDIEKCEKYPEALVSLTKKQQLLMVGQPYKVQVNIELPENEVNERIGMFKICATMKDQANVLQKSSCKLSMLRYRSPLLKKITTLVLSPFLIMGYREEKQLLTVELFSSLEDDQTYPITDVLIRVESKEVEIYSVQLHITAHFTGLRYFMYNWPLLSTCIGVGSNLFFILIICCMSWFHFEAGAEWLIEENAKKSKSENNSDLKTTNLKTDLVSIENKSNDDTEEISQMKDKNLTTDDDISIIEAINSDDELDPSSEIEILHREEKHIENLVME